MSKVSLKKILKKILQILNDLFKNKLNCLETTYLILKDQISEA